MILKLRPDQATIGGNMSPAMFSGDLLHVAGYRSSIRRHIIKESCLDRCLSLDDNLARPDQISSSLKMDAITAAGVSAAFIIINSKKQKRRWWKKEFLRKSESYGDVLLSELLLNDGSSFKNFVRMTKSDFEIVLGLVAPKIFKKNTKYRASISPAIRLAITLRYLATGDSYTSLMYLFKVSKQSISIIVPEVCEALIQALREFCRLPTSEEEWHEVANGFATKWNFSHCIGAIDGKHVQIEAPQNSGSIYYNYHGTFSIVLMAIADADYKIRYADVGCQGRISDGGVFKSTDFYNNMINNRLRIPKPSLLPGTSEVAMPYVLVADDAFELSKNLLKPFPGSFERGSLERIFNYRLSRARRIVENVFGLLVTVFRVFRKPIPLEPEKVVAIVLACVHLHNFLRRNAQSIRFYSPPGTFDTEDFETGEIIPGTWRAELQQSALLDLRSIPRRSTDNAQEIRKEWARYFASVHGKVPWQDKFT